MTTKPKAPNATHTDTQAAQAAENAGQAQHQATAPATAAGSGDAAAVVSAAPTAQAAPTAPPVHNPKRGGLYRQVGGDQPVAVHRTLHPGEEQAKA